MRPSAPTPQPGPLAFPGPPPRSTKRWWQREGMVTRLLAVSGAVVTLAGVVMLLVLAAQRGWFGPVPRVVGGAILAAGLVVCAHWVRARQGRAGRYGNAGPVAMAATGYAAAYLDVVAVTAIYGWVPATIGLVIAAAIAATGLVIARLWDSQLLAVITVLGAALMAPFVSHGTAWLLCAFLVVLAIAAWPAQVDRDWPVVTVSRVLPAGLALMVSPAVVDQRSQTYVVIALGVALLLATITSTTFTARRFPADVTGALVVPVSGLGAMATVVDQPTSVRSGALVAIAGVLMLALTATLRAPIGPVPRHLSVAFGGTGTLALLLAIGDALPSAWIGTGLLAVAATYLLVAGASRSPIMLWLAVPVTLIAILGAVHHVPPVLSPTLATRHDLGALVVDSLLLATMTAAGVWATRRVPGATAVRPVATTFAWVFGLSATVGALVGTGVLIGRQIGEAEGGFTAGHALATIAWMGAAAWLLIHGLKRAKDSELALRLGLVLAGLSVAKLFLFDLAALDGIWRVAAFIVTGLLLLATGTGYAKALERSRRAAQPPAPRPAAPREPIQPHARP